ncbi:MAG TPA: M23 family metallopeptidase [Candidatus Baltobacteraceae bacterium]|nr:M23 family metallopeptidase [Candidatus Baltobacteraceae bacterium]
MLLASGAAPRHGSHGSACVYARPVRRTRPGRRAVPGALAVRRLVFGRRGADRRVGAALVLVLVLLTSLFAILPAATAHQAATGQVVNPGIAALRAAAPETLTGQAPAPGPLGSETPAPSSGPFAADGTLLTPVAVQPAQAPFEVRVYAVARGDTLTGIAARFGLSMMTLWWANTLSSKDQLHVGQLLRIPPVDGVLYTAQEGDTVAGVAGRFHADPAAVAAYNGLPTDELTLGQQVMIPNGVGSSIAAAPTTPAARPTSKAAAVSVATGCTACGFAPLAWPVPGGYISQPFGCTGFYAEPPLGNCPHFHRGIDIAAPTGTRIVAAAAGTVTFAGWKNNGGGYQVWISDGHDFYTGYHHMSAVLVHTGQRVGRGQLIGRVGMTGDATGPHCHFEVWIGPIWAGGHVVNPLAYF